MASSPLGRPTRGTTGTNRLRRNDRWIAASDALRRASDPLVIDLGYGASGVTAFELATRLVRVRGDVEVRGLEIDPARVTTADTQLAEVRAGRTSFASDLPVSFARGGFEVPLPDGRRAAVIRAMNVLRQYDEKDVPDAWSRMAARLAPGGLLFEGTCDEIGRVASWIDVDAQASPLRFTISLRLADLERPSIVAERLPKALIHRNVAGERIHALLVDFDREWDRAAPLSTFGATQRFLAAVAALRDQGWPVLGGRTRWRLGEVTLPWAAVAPRTD
ncbi:MULTISPECIES: class I SAM-dependent methyltransferase [unclassified Microbacterium]|uniref:class I SAM-dependent methyltransferase n=1 Tax=unclassified Microbacterium TaxID=2609290 RepID=UPI000CFDA8B4|nr:MULTISPECIES: class I SAM-dependent methyltransferase [unclassified Microbacterium]PQZ52850.1 SAM-dependent methyltransferase [Microbacterium sp. MYb43]PQZ74623.1 SAM-dependent methyltransferase [Microbacterium sp. MYb40]PRB19480.1 SAM-dependent methyltransferase [Microbacterium sp. MYb54]PRB24813.1 SAM-dependent methyltransferase [Microbacterium sp. MYb50]PRB62989.1 SAM-dependent methyltransferase [Microbacterium sp. MYb24]